MTDSLETGGENEIPDAEDVDEASWRAGYAAAMQAVAETAHAHAEIVGAMDADTDEESDDEDGECPTCGRDLVEALGSPDPVCPTCDT